MEDGRKPGIAPLILGIIGTTLITVAVILGIIGSVLYMVNDGYDYDSTRFAIGMGDIGKSLFWAGAGLDIFGLILALRKR